MAHPDYDRHMAKRLSLRDFRAVRWTLEERDFGLVRGRTRRASRDRIDEPTWKSITSLPDHVAIETSNHFGTVLRDLYSLCGAWTGTFAPLEKGGPRLAPLWVVALDGFHVFEGSLYGATFGYYRLAVTGLRSMVENLVIALHLELSGDRKTFRRWQAGDVEPSFGQAASLLPRYPSVAKLEDALRRRTGNDLFRHKQSPPQPKRTPGYARAFFSTLSKFTHAQPEFTDAALWGGSNGPIFVPRSFGEWAKAYVSTFALSLLLLRLGRPDLERLDDESDPSLRGLFESAVGMLPSRAPLRRALRAVPKGTWGR
jgi:hypothetical protein